MKKSLLAIVLLLLLPRPGSAQVNYPNKPDGLKDLVDSLLTATRNKQPAVVATEIERLVLPNADSWFRQTFGETAGARLAGEYQQVVAEMNTALPQILSRAAQEAGSGWIYRTGERGESVEAYIMNAAFAATNRRGEIYMMGFTAKKSREPIPLGSFVFVDGGFRYLGYVLVVTTGGQSVPRLLSPGAALEFPKQVRFAQPGYPDLARRARIGGVVRVRATIGADGAIKQLEVLSGHPLLIVEVLDTMRRWRFTAAKLGSKPFDVQILVEVDFVS